MLITFGPGTANPYQFTFDPPADVIGSPSVVTPDLLIPLSGRGFGMQGDPARPSMAHVLTSFGMDVGVPTNEAGELIPGSSTLEVSALCTSLGVYITMGTFGSASVAVWYKVYIEEFLEDGSFVQAVEGPRTFVVNESHWYFAGSDVWEPIGPASHGVLANVPAREGHQYRVWIDVEGQITADGGGGFTDGFAFITGFSPSGNGGFRASVESVVTQFA